MRVTLLFDEPIAGATVAAGTTLSATAANAEALSALLLVNRAVQVTDAASPLSGNVQFALIDQRARRPFRGVSLSSGIVPPQAPAGTPLAQIITNSPGPITMIGDGGGKLALVGRFLAATASPIAAGEQVTVVLSVGGENRTFTIAAAGKPLPVSEALASAVDGQVLTSAVDGVNLRSAI